VTSEDTGCGSFAEEGDCIVSFICTKDLGKKCYERFFAMLIKFSACSERKPIYFVKRALTAPASDRSWDSSRSKQSSEATCAVYCLN